MPEIIYPESLPCVSRIDGYGLASSASLVRTPFEAGNARQRRWNWVLPSEIKIAWRVANVDLHRLFTWLNAYGYDWFTIELASLESSILGEVAVPISVRLTSDLDIALNPVYRQNWWTVSASAAYIAIPEVLEYIDPSTRITEDATFRTTEDGTGRTIEG